MNICLGAPESLVTPLHIITPPCSWQTVPYCRTRDREASVSVAGLRPWKVMLYIHIIVRCKAQLKALLNLAHLITVTT